MLNNPNWGKEPTQLDETSLWLLQAADYIEKYGWWDGHGGIFKALEFFKTSQGYQPACMLQALAVTNLGKSVIDPGGPNDRLEKFLGTNLVHKWNDSHTKEECIKALRDCAYTKEVST